MNSCLISNSKDLKRFMSLKGLLFSALILGYYYQSTHLYFISFLSLQIEGMSHQERGRLNTQEKQVLRCNSVQPCGLYPARHELLPMLPIGSAVNER